MGGKGEVRPEGLNLPVHYNQLAHNITREWGKDLLGLMATALFWIRTSSSPGLEKGASLTTNWPPLSSSQTPEFETDMMKVIEGSDE